jgi:hypothetical protein
MMFDRTRKWDNAAMTEPQNPSPRSRLQALLAIPDNQRSEEQWDELHELEITLAPGNRIGQQERQNPPGGLGRSGGRGAPRGGAPKGGFKGENRGGRGGQAPRPANNGQRKPAEQAQAEGAPPEAGQESPAGAVPAKKPFRRFHKKPPKPAES